MLDVLLTELPLLAFLLIGVATCLYGAVVAKIRYKSFWGYKAKATVQSPEIWKATHRFAARCLFAEGALTILLSLLIGPYAWVLVAGTPLILAPYLYPYFAGATVQSPPRIDG